MRGHVIIASAFDLSTNLPLIVAGIALGSIYGIVALGFVLVYKSTGVLNLAQGDFLMLGAYLSVTLLVTNDLGLYLALPLVALSMACVGLAIHYTVMRRLVGQPFFSIVLATIGIGTIIRALVLILYGPIERGRLGALPEGSFEIAGTRIQWASVVIVAHRGPAPRSASPSSSATPGSACTSAPSPTTSRPPRPRASSPTPCTPSPGPCRSASPASPACCSATSTT